MDTDTKRSTLRIVCVGLATALCGRALATLKKGVAVAGIAAAAMLMGGGATTVQGQGVGSDVLSKAREAVYGEEATAKSQGGLPTPGAKDGPLAKVGMNLAVLHYEYRAFRRNGAEESFTPTNRAIEVRDGTVIIDAIPAGSPDRLKSDLERIGATQVAVAGNLVSGRIEIEEVPAVARLSSLQSAQAVGIRRNDGAVQSQGVAAMQADSVLLDGFNGSGTTVGVLSDSYDALGPPPSAADDIESGDLPPARKINVLEDLPPDAGSDEGRAMMQLIHDVAPGAGMAFHTAFGGRANFAQGIQDLADAGSDVIVDDIIYFAEPMFQEGPIAQAVNDVKERGVPYFSSAGNAADQSYESAFRLAGNSHDFNPGDEVDTTQTIRIPRGETVTISFQWADPYASAGNAGADGDLDVQLLSKEGDLLFEAGDNNIGGDPVELVGIQNPGTIDADGDGVPDENFQIRVVLAEGEAPPRAKYVYFGTGISIEEYGTESPTSYGHANAAGAEAVGAAYYQRTPEFGVDPAEIRSFSAKGGVPIYSFNEDGSVAKTVTRQKPEIVAPDGTDNTFFGSDLDGQFTAPNFSGTSAAAPHAAGVAALMVDKNANLATPTGAEGSPLGPDSLYTFLRRTAAGMNGPANRVGDGLIRADEAMEQVPAGGPQVPPILSANAANGWAQINWEGFIDADSYNVYRTEGASFVEARDRPDVDTTKITGFNPVETTFTDPNVTNGTAYYYRVTAVVDGQESSLSAADERRVVPSELQVSGIEPSSGLPGSTVRIFGAGFGSDPTVQFLSFPSGDVVGASDVTVDEDGDRITATIPRELGEPRFSELPGLGAVAVFPVVNSSVVSNEVFTLSSRPGRGGELISGFEVEQSFSETATTIHLANLDNDGLNDLIRVVPGGRGGGIGGGPPPRLQVQLTTAAFGTYDDAFTLDTAPVADVHAGDLNKDGRQDVVAVLEDGTVQWYRNRPAGPDPFARGQVISTSAADGRAVHVADVTNDGDPDVIVGTGGGPTQGGRVLLYENEGGGTFASGTEIATNATVPVQAVAASDVNEDGTPDVLAIDDDEVEWYNSEDGFAPNDIATGLEGGTDLRVADLNGDARPDVLTTEGQSNETLWYANQSSGFATEADTVSATPPSPRSLSVGDIDSDGDQDVLVGKEGTASVPDSVRFAWFENTDGSGTFGESNVISAARFPQGGGVDIEAVDATALSATDLIGGEALGDGVPDVLATKTPPGFGTDPVLTLFGNREPVPAAPESLEVATGNAATPELNWNASASPDDDVAGYNIYRARQRFDRRERFDNYGPAEKVNEELVTSTSFTDETASAGAQYFYRVVAQDTLGNAGSGVSNIGQIELEGLAVYPGDLNNDGTVDQNDVMTLGSFWNSGGPARNRVGCGFAASEAEPWSPVEATYADANGDGEVNQADTRCIGANWNRSQPESGTSSSVLASKEKTSGKLRVRPVEEPTIGTKAAGGRTFQVEVAVNGEAPLAGTAFELEYPTDALSVESVEPGPSMGEDALAMHRVDADAGRVGVGLARTTGAVQEGAVARIELRMEEGARGPFTMQLHQGAGRGKEGETVALKTGAPRELSPLPTEFSVDGNAPNPVQKRTTIRYALPEAADVKITVYDVLGREVRVLVDEQQRAGQKKVQLRADDLASGTYFYRVKAGEHVETRKLQVVR